MLIGEYIHKIDEKNRVSLPFKFRKEMGKKIIITPGLGQCLFIFTNKEWQKVSKKLSDSDTDFSKPTREVLTDTCSGGRRKWKWILSDGC